METITLELGDTVGPQNGVQYIEVAPADYRQNLTDSQEESPTYSGLVTMDQMATESYQTSENVNLLGEQNIQLIGNGVETAQITTDGTTCTYGGVTYQFSDLLASDHSTTELVESKQRIKTNIKVATPQMNYLNGSNQSLTAMPGVQMVTLPGLPLTPNTLPLSNFDKSEEPLYVNAKQYHRILKRREARAKLEARGRIAKERSKYIYNSRHQHAKKRERGPGGTFLKRATPQSPLNKENLT